MGWALPSVTREGVAEPGPSQERGDRRQPCSVSPSAGRRGDSRPGWGGGSGGSGGACKGVSESELAASGRPASFARFPMGPWRQTPFAVLLSPGLRSHWHSARARLSFLSSEALPPSPPAPIHSHLPEPSLGEPETTSPATSSPGGGEEPGGPALPLDLNIGAPN